MAALAVGSSWQQQRSSWGFSSDDDDDGSETDSEVSAGLKNPNTNPHPSPSPNPNPNSNPKHRAEKCRASQPRTAAAALICRRPRQAGQEQQDAHLTSHCIPCSPTHQAEEQLLRDFSAATDELTQRIRAALCANLALALTLTLTLTLTRTRTRTRT